MWVLILFQSVFGRYIPGIAQNDYTEGVDINLTVNKLDSAKSQLPFDYYYLNFCKPKNTKQVAENLGLILSGARIEDSMYKLKMNKNNTCELLCHKQNNKSDRDDFRWMIDNEYKAQWIVDNLPAGLRLSSYYVEGQPARVNYYQDGFPIGVKQAGEYFVYNHVNIILQVFEVSHDQEYKYRITGFLVEPFSFEQTEDDLACKKHGFEDYLKSSEKHKEVDLHSDEYANKLISATGIKSQNLSDETTYSYSVIFEKSHIPWASRWDKYLYMTSDSTEVHWLSIINSFAMVLFLSGMVAHILVRNVRRDIRTYNERTELDPENDSGWKQIRGEIFRAPLYSGLFTIIVATGTQLIVMGFILLFFTCLGFLSPAYRGGLLTASLLIFAFLGFLAGYISARLFKMFGGVHWKSNALGTALLFPGICFVVFFVINLLLWAEESSGAVPFLNILSMLVLWFGISVPLVFLGHAIGYKKPAITNPCKVNRIPKPLAVLSGVSRIKAVCLIAGSLPFGCMFIELSYIMKSIWHHTTFYYLFGFLFLCFLVLIITSAEVSILMTYILLCKEDYRWWWISIGVSGSSGLYLFAYSLIYYMTELEITRLSASLLYFGYMLLASLAYGLITGSVGFLATYKFIRVIYTQIHVD